MQRKHVITRAVVLAAVGLLTAGARSANGGASFDFVIATTASPQTFSFQVDGAAGFEIDWGLGEGFTAVADGSGLRSREYAAAGTYTIKVRGAAGRIAFYGGTPALLQGITSKLSDGVTGITSAQDMFRNCIGITQFTQADWFDDTSGSVTTMHSMFSGASSFDQDISSWDVNGVANGGFASMFHGATVFNNGGSPGMNNWNLSNYTGSLGSMFKSARAFDQPLGNWDTSGVSSIREMFNDARVFDQDIGTKVVNEGAPDEYTAWEVSNVTDAFGLYQVFWQAWAFNNGGSDSIGDWDVSNYSSSMGNLFRRSFAFDQDISRWDVSKVTSFGSFFNLDNINVSSAFSTANYDKLLLAWSELDVRTGREFHGGAARHSVQGAVGKLKLIEDFGWTFIEYPNLDDQGMIADNVVSNINELQAVKLGLSENYVLANDIDASATSSWYYDDANARYNGFAPLGDGAAPFSGVFDGRGRLLSGLYIDRPDTPYVGLFGNMSGTLKALGVTGTVAGSNYVGGVVGLLGGGGVIEDGYARVAVTAGADDRHRGGFAGRNEQGAVRRVYATGAVLPAGGSNGGGLVGSKDDGDAYEDTANFWDRETSGWDAGAMGAGLTTSQMRDIHTYSVAGWTIAPAEERLNDGYPFLVGQATEGPPAWTIFAAPGGTLLVIH